MIPKHNNPTQPRVDTRRREHWARAPYNFIPLPEPEQLITVKELPDQDNYSDYNGWIECDLEACSPLYVRGMLTASQFAQGFESKDQPDFFSTGQGKLKIPGSSLRGSIRELVEIVSYGKISWVQKEPLVFRAVGDRTSLGDYYRDHLMRDDGNKHYVPLMKAGYLEHADGAWQIRPVKEIGGTTFARIPHELMPEMSALPPWKNSLNARKIWVKVGAFAFQPVRGGSLHIKYSPVLQSSVSSQSGFETGVLVCSGPMDKKKSEAVFFEPDTTADPTPISPEMVQAYRDQISQEQQALMGKNGALVDGQPVFYREENDQLIFFGHVMMFRLPYGRSPLDFVPKELRDDSDIDLAEAIFGFVRDKKMPRDQSSAYAGRVFFTDAKYVQNSQESHKSSEPITPQILASPKPTAFQHYLTQRQPDTMPSGRTNKDGSPKMVMRLDHYASSPKQTTIRGHKLYWHKGRIGLKDIEETGKKNVDWNSDTQHTRIQPVTEGAKFRFRIYFENLREYELGALLWVLKLSDGATSPYRLSLGMGKPLGMGAVRIIPSLSLTDRKKRYGQLFDGQKWWESARAEDAQPFISAFEKVILEKVASGKKKLADVDRIKMLMEMLKWPGPDRSLTRYMQIQHSYNGNEYKERPVLPDPLNIKEPSESTNLTGQKKNPVPSTQPMNTISNVRGQTAYKSNDVEKKATVIRSDDGNLYVILPKLPNERIAFKPKPGYSKAEPGTKIRVRILVDKNNNIKHAEEL